MDPRARRPLAPLALALAAGCASESPKNEVVDLIRDAHYTDAVRLAAERAEQHPDDPAAAALHRDATVALLLDQGRQSVFEGRLEDALDLFNQALALDPHNPATSAWIVKTRDELTRVWLDAGLELILAESFEQALEAYQLALYYTPEVEEGLLGASRVLFLMNYRQGMGEDYYNQGVRAVYKHLLTQARGKFSYVGKYMPRDDRAKERRAEVESELAKERNIVARGFEDQAYYGAAFNEYRLILMLEPANAEAKAGYERMEREVKAQRLLSEADKLVRQNRLDEALAKLEQGSEMTQLQRDRFSLLVNQIEVAHWEALYRQGTDAEQDYRYEDAITAYGRLLDEAEFYEDAADRKKTLEEYVERAKSLYANLETATDPAEQEQILREISLFWPEYRDVRQRLAAFGGE
jgi:tetratricopeptide (TPR) repeat protein